MIFSAFPSYLAPSRQASRGLLACTLLLLVSAGAQAQYRSGPGTGYARAASELVTHHAGLTEQMALHVVPNPVRTGQAGRAVVTVFDGGGLRLRLSDATGRTHWTHEAQLTAGAHEIALPNRLPPGWYVLEVHDSRSAQRQRVVVR